jgi:hypothetical protein
MLVLLGGHSRAPRCDGAPRVLAAKLVLAAAALCITHGGAMRSFLTAPIRVQLSPFFIPNHGQVQSEVRYIIKAPALEAGFDLAAVHLNLRGATLRVGFAGANASPRLEALDELPGRANFLLGSQPAQWKTNLPTYATLAYRDLYPGIDALYRGLEDRLKSEFIVAPGADPSLIRLVYSGVQRLRLDSSGALLLTTAAGELRERLPEIYQEVRGKRILVNGGFQLHPGSAVGFRVGPYDRSLPLRIDPVLSYSTFLGGSRFDSVASMAIDAAGNAYLTGWTESADFPTSGPVQAGNRGGVDVFVAKLNRSGALVYSTYIGGSGDDRGFGVALDAAGSAYVTGWTSSNNLPTVAPLQAALAGRRDAFVLKLNPAGNALVYSTYLGGSGTDSGNAIAVDSSGSAYVTGDTDSLNFPTRNPIQSSNAGLQDAFVARLAATGSSLVFSTYLGGYGQDRGSGIALDSAGNAYITGATTSLNFPTAGALQASNGGGQDAFVAKLNALGTSLLYSTYLGGRGGAEGFGEEGRGIAVDSSGNAYVTGTTSSTNFPLLNPIRSTPAGTNDAFVTKLNPAGSALLYSTLLGGSGMDIGTALAVDPQGSAVVTGYTSSPDFPTTFPAQPSHAGLYDVFLARLNPAGTALLFSTFLGGSASDSGNAVGLDAAGNLYVAGQTSSWDFPVRNPVQSVNGGGFGGFVASFSTVGPTCASVGPNGVVTAATSGLINVYAYGVQNATAVKFPAWSQVNGQDDLIWYPGTDLGGGTWTGSIDLARHRPGNPDYGDILVDVWMSGGAGTADTHCGGVAINRISSARPTCSGLAGPSRLVTTATSGTLDFFAYGVQNATGISFAAWSRVNGQDDLIWYPAVYQRGGTWKVSIDLSKHRPGNPDYGEIPVDAWTNSQPSVYCGEGIIVRTYPNPPVCTGVSPQSVATSATSGTIDFYAYSVQNAFSVSFPTWSRVNGQDDIIWYPGVNQGGGTWKASIDLSKHRPGHPDYGDIIVDAWMQSEPNAYYCGEGIIVRTDPNPPVCSGVGPQGVVTSATSGSLDFYAYGVQNASSVSFPTWSRINGQDDIIWYPGVNQGGGTWKASIDLSKHRPGNPDYGDIIIDVWLEGSRSVYCGETILIRRP